MSNNDAKRTEFSSYTLELEGHQYLKFFIKTLRKLPIRISLLELAWTAGPVTFIGLQLGHYIGFGNFADKKIILYFASYTLFAGIIALITRHLTNLNHNAKTAVANNEYLFVIENLINAYLKSRDIILADSENQELIADQLILSNSYISANNLNQLLDKYLSNKKLIHEICNVLMYRQAGMHQLADQKFNFVYSLYTEEFHQLQERNREIYRLLELHCKGKMPTLKLGVERTQGFLARIIHACNTNDWQAVSIYDVSEMLVLAIELITSREFPYYKITYKGQKKVTKLFENLEYLRRETQVSLSVLYGRINLLDNLMLEKKAVNINRDLKTINLDGLYSEVMNYHQELLRQSTRNLGSLHDLKNNLALFKQIYKACKRLQESINRFVKNYTRYKHEREKWDKFKAENNANNYHFTSIKLELETIQLSQELTLSIAQQLADCFDENLFFSRKFLKKSLGYKLEHAKKLAIDIATILDDELDINNPSILNTLQNSNAINLNCIEENTSVTYKLGLCSTLSKEIVENNQKNIQALMETLENTYGINIDNALLKYLSNLFDVKVDSFAPRKTLNDLRIYNFDDVYQAVHKKIIYRGEWLSTINSAEQYLKNSN